MRVCELERSSGTVDSVESSILGISIGISEGVSDLPITFSFTRSSRTNDLVVEPRIRTVNRMMNNVVVTNNSLFFIFFFSFSS